MEEELIKRQIRINKIKIIADVILIILFIVIAIYIYGNIESFKLLSNDVCKLCMNKTGGICTKPFLK